MGTGSGSAQYGGVEEWRHAMKNPPPVPGEYSYIYLRWQGFNQLAIMIIKGSYTANTEEPCYTTNHFEIFSDSL